VNELVLSGGEGNSPKLYDQMRKAIAACHSVDECKNISDRSKAFSAYFKQMNDDTSVRLFNEVKLRAFRRMGEIIIAGMDFSQCESHSAKVRLVRASTSDIEIESLNDSQLLNAIRLAELPEDGFEAAIDRVNGSITSMLRFGDPSWLAAQERESKAAEERRKQWERDRPKREEQERIAAEERAKAAEEQRQDALAELAEVERLKAANDEAMREAGVTLNRRDRKKQHQLVFIMKTAVYETLRDAAHEKRVTMHEVLRRGLAMWFSAHGYVVRDEP
jgi:hypothetical protein